MSELNPHALKRRAAEYIGKRERTSGVAFPLQGDMLNLCVLMMCGFAAEIAIEVLRDLSGDET